MQGMITVTILLLAGMLLYRFRAPVVALLRRFDERNRARKLEEANDRRDSLAHFRHTLRLAEEQVDEIGELRVRDPKTGDDVMRYTFQGAIYANRAEAEDARQDAVVAKAREFYVDLPAALRSRGDGRIR